MSAVPKLVVAMALVLAIDAPAQTIDGTKALCRNRAEVAEDPAAEFVTCLRQEAASMKRVREMTPDAPRDLLARCREDAIEPVIGAIFFRRFEGCLVFHAEGRGEIFPWRVIK